MGAGAEHALILWRRVEHRYEDTPRDRHRARLTVQRPRGPSSAPPMQCADRHALRCLCAGAAIA